MAQREGIEAAALDAVTLRSHERALAAWAQGRFDARVIPVKREDGTVLLDRDENPRDYGDGAALAKLAPIFEKAVVGGFDEILLAERPELGEIRHVHTLAHCPPVSDGAALLIIGSREAGERFGLSPVARIVSTAETADDHVLQLTAGFTALDRVLDRAGLDLSAVGAVEFMEAFAAAPVKFERDRAPDLDKVNVNGGHLALGHPMGASGAILLGALLDSMDALGASTGVTAATGGVGVGAAMVLERA